tara:strand:- start:26 stop:529 length:504 start_codon:yes stop_codon:yes gene_type:complete
MALTKQIPDYEDYKIDENGNVFSCKYNKIKPMIPQKATAGYQYVTLCKNGTRRNRFIHRLVAQVFIENPENKLEVNHKNGNKYDNNLSNLEWVTPSENIKHAIKLGLIVCSERSKELLRARSIKKTQDIITGKIYDSLKNACLDLDINYPYQVQRMTRGRESRLKYI